MKKILYSFLFFFISLFLLNCSTPKSSLNKNLEELDKLYGYCDNPHRSLNKRDYKICKDKERANAGKSFGFKDKTLKEMLIDSIKDDIGATGIAGGGTTVNIYLWQGSIQTLENYPIKILDSNGGYIETEWIYQESAPNERCLIKINITSKELLSSGVNAKIICQNKYQNEWQNIAEEINLEENKKITLAILEKANVLRDLDLKQN